MFFPAAQSKQCGASNTKVIGIYIFYNLVYTVFAFPLVMLADRIGLQKMLVSGIGLFDIVCFGMGLNHNIYIFIGVFMPQRPQESRKFGLAILRTRKTSLRPLAPTMLFKVSAPCWQAPWLD
jgi:MFS family permease